MLFNDFEMFWGTTSANTTMNTSVNTPVNTSVNTPANTSANAPVNAAVTTVGTLIKVVPSFGKGTLSTLFFKVGGLRPPPPLLLVPTLLGCC